MASENKGKQPLNEGYEPLQKGYSPKEKRGYSPTAERPPVKPPKGRSGLITPTASSKK